MPCGLVKKDQSSLNRVCQPAIDRNQPLKLLNSFAWKLAFTALTLGFVLLSCSAPPGKLPGVIPTEPQPTSVGSQFLLPLASSIPDPTSTIGLLQTPIKPTQPLAITDLHPTSTPLAFYSGPMTIGTSAGGRPLIIHRFGTGPTQRLIIAGIHGGFEWNTIELANQMIKNLQEKPGLIPSDKTLYILPSLNPDGEARGHGPDARANENGVDLNRNFPINWLVDWPRTGCWQMGTITAGEAPFSEPESAALAQLLLEHPVDAILSYHSAGLGIYPGEDPRSQQSIPLAQSLAAVSHYDYPGLDTGCLHTGTLVDYAAELGIAAVDLELTTRWDTELQENLAVLQAFLGWVSRTGSSLPSPGE